MYPDKEEEPSADEEEELDLEAQVAKELAELKQPVKDTKRSLFTNIATNMDCGKVRPLFFFNANESQTPFIASQCFSSEHVHRSNPFRSSIVS